MNITLIHSLQYYYSAEVWLEPHQIYLYPKPSAAVKVNAFQLHINPQPDFIATNTDWADNVQHVTFFTKTCRELSIQSQTTLELAPYNPYSFLYFPFETSKLPFLYPQELQASLQPYLIRQEITTLIDQTARHLAAAANWNTNVFLSEVNTFVHELTQDETGNTTPQHPEVTLIKRKGNNNDLVALFVALCRAMGIAARFVNGYYIQDLSAAKVNFHAWVQVYLPGGGWRGYDALHHCLASHTHIALQTTQHAQYLIPIKGFFRGKAQSTLRTTIEMRINNQE